MRLAALQLSHQDIESRVRSYCETVGMRGPDRSWLDVESGRLIVAWEQEGVALAFAADERGVMDVDLIRLEE